MILVAGSGRLSRTQEARRLRTAVGERTPGVRFGKHLDASLASCVRSVSGTLSGRCLQGHDNGKERSRYAAGRRRAMVRTVPQPRRTRPSGRSASRRRIWVNNRSRLSGAIAIWPEKVRSRRM
jgi:hypothetical protein